MNLFIDVETVPSQHPEALAAVRANLKPPATLKKPESIAAWWANEAEQAAADGWRKQSLDGGTQGEIISIALVSDRGQQWVHCRAQGASEADLLANAFAQVSAWNREEADRITPNHPDAWPTDDVYPVAHNAAFDLGFLWRRGIVNRVALPGWLPGPQARAGKDFGCSMLTWAGFGGRVSLDSLCRALGVPSPKGDMEGSQVFDRWLAGDTQAIAAYNLSDTLALSEVWHRLQGRGRV